jgi:pimeloyl-ACP methyl ester carboxylesterase
MKLPLAFVFLLATCATAVADDGPAYGPQLEGYDYPFPVQHYRFQSQGEAMDMAYMDVKPATPNGRTLVLLHGKNFCAATWGATITVLTAAGYRVIAPDQIGFCKSTKPAHYQYSFEQLAANTHALLASLGISRVTIMGHSMGGMLATRYALTYPDSTEQLVSVNPLGLEDGRARLVEFPDLGHSPQIQDPAAFHKALLDGLKF